MQNHVCIHVHCPLFSLFLLFFLCCFVFFALYCETLVAVLLMFSLFVFL